MLTEVVAVAATLSGLVRSWPQAFRVARQTDVRGVSGPTWLLALSNNITWLIICVLEHVAVAALSNLLNGLAGATVLALLLRRGRLPGWHLTATISAAVVVNVGTYVAIGPAGPAVLGIGLAVVMFVPQAATVLRRSAAGVSLLTWTLALITSSLWAVYGVLIESAVFVAPNAVMAPLAAVIVWRVAASRARRPVALTP